MSILFLTYFKDMVFFFSDDPFYSSQIKIPTVDTLIPPSITNNHHFHWFNT
ncbi:hypothetical protein BDR03DRAFT_877070 [Suillus americanus]|nr:hypothetical protein BDR03DRAFT_877070 [Suillus americanus]